MSVAQFTVPPIVKSVVVRAAPTRAFEMLPANWRDGGRWRNSTPGPTPSIARSSRASAGAFSSERKTDTRRRGEP